MGNTISEEAEETDYNEISDSKTVPRIPLQGVDALKPKGQLISNQMATKSPFNEACNVSEQKIQQIPRLYLVTAMTWFCFNVKVEKASSDESVVNPPLPIRTSSHEDMSLDDREIELYRDEIKMDELDQRELSPEEEAGFGLEEALSDAVQFFEKRWIEFARKMLFPLFNLYFTKTEGEISAPSLGVRSRNSVIPFIQGLMAFFKDIWQIPYKDGQDNIVGEWFNVNGCNCTCGTYFLLACLEHVGIFNELNPYRIVVWSSGVHSFFTIYDEDGQVWLVESTQKKTARRVRLFDKLDYEEPPSALFTYWDAYFHKISSTIGSSKLYKHYSQSFKTFATDKGKFDQAVYSDYKIRFEHFFKWVANPLILQDWLKNPKREIDHNVWTRFSTLLDILKPFDGNVTIERFRMLLGIWLTSAYGPAYTNIKHALEFEILFVIISLLKQEFNRLKPSLQYEPDSSKTVQDYQARFRADSQKPIIFTEYPIMNSILDESINSIFGQLFCFVKFLQDDYSESDDKPPKTFKYMTNVIQGYLTHFLVLIDHTQIQYDYDVPRYIQRKRPEWTKIYLDLEKREKSEKEFNTFSKTLIADLIAVNTKAVLLERQTNAPHEDNIYDVFREHGVTLLQNPTTG